MDADTNALLADALCRHRLLGTRQFFVSQEEIIALLSYVLCQTTRPSLSLNRRQVGGWRLVHWVEWLDLKFTSVSTREIVVVREPPAR